MGAGQKDFGEWFEDLYLGRYTMKIGQLRQLTTLLGTTLLLAMLLQHVNGEDKPEPPPLAYRYTLAAVGKAEIAVFFLYQRGKLQNVSLGPPAPTGEHPVLKQEYIVLATDGTQIVIKAQWNSSTPPELESSTIAPAHPRKPVEKNEAIEEEYILRAKEGAQLKLVCKWRGDELLNSTLEILRRKPATK
jgi:hypothetical protein